jgi:DNA-binding NarL/FixJ family response regulator
MTIHWYATDCEPDWKQLRILRSLLKQVTRVTRYATRRPKIDLVLMDINLAGINGIELTARFHTLHPAVAVLMLSMHDSAEYVMQSIQSGARGYVLKDAPAIDIITAIDTVMAGGTYYSAGIARKMTSQFSPPVVLTPRENEVLQSIANGKSNKHIARELDLSVRTVETHRLNITRKLGIEGQADLIRFALERAPLKI